MRRRAPQQQQQRQQSTADHRSNVAASSSSSSSAVLAATAEGLDAVKRRLATGSTTSAAGEDPTDIWDAETATPLTSASSTPSFRVSTSSDERPAIRREADGVVEEIGQNEAGLSWGFKQATDGSWSEKWVEQTIAQKQAGEKPGEVVDTQVAFGRSSGKDSLRGTEWHAEWRGSTRPDGASTKTIHKDVTKGGNEEAGRPPERWAEDITITREPDGAETVVSRRRGENTELERWQFEETVSKDSSGAEISRNCVRTTVTDNEHRCESSTSAADGSTSNELKTISRETETVVQKRQETSAEGTKKGSEEHFDKDAKLQHSIHWTEETNGQRERVEISHPDQYTRREFRSGLEPTTGESWNEIIETEVVTNESGQVTRTRRTVDKWRTRGQSKWGEKCTETKNFTQNARGTNTVQDDTIERENWHDNNNGGDRFVDSWKVVKQRRPDGTVERCIESGTKAGTEDSGTAWGEKWERVYEPAEQVGTTTPEHQTQSLERPQCPESGSECDGLILRSRMHDKWWDERARNNRWGERRFIDLRECEEHNEDWYANGTEEQHDSWELRAGVRRGEKHGWSVDGKRKWSEKWEGQRPENEEGGDEVQQPQYFIDKWWEDAGVVDGERVRWGHVEGAAEGRTWNERWGLAESSDGASRSWFDRHCRHADGNEETERRGNEFSPAGHNWWHERYGTHFDEKWAVKKGANERGEEWEDSWNETPSEKRATKSGRNRSGEWSEAWHERGQLKWAEKQGKSYADGNEWLESWVEDGTQKKTALKRGKNAEEEWEERWGEEFGPDGGEKWADKWCRRRDGGSSKGESWGEKWGPNKGHKWGEKWADGHVHDKWAHDTDGTPPC